MTMRRLLHAAGKLAACCALALSVGAARAADALLVFPFREAAPPADGETSAPWLSGAFMVSFAERMQGPDLLAVSPTQTLSILEAQGRSWEKGRSMASALSVARDVEADLMVTGNFALLPGRRIRVQGVLVQVEPLKQLASESREGSLDELQDLIEALRHAFGAALGLPDPAFAKDPPPLAAYEAYVKGLLHPDPQPTIRLLQEALRLFPAFPEARYHLAKTAFEERDYELARNTLAGVADHGHPYGAGVRLIRGLLALREGNLVTARVHLERSTMIRPTFEAHLALAALSLREGNADRAQRDLLVAEALGAPDAEVNRILEGGDPLP